MKSGRLFVIIVIFLSINVMFFSNNIPFGNTASYQGKEIISPYDDRMFEIMESPRWKHYGTSLGGHFCFYDIQSIIRDKNVVRIWHKRFGSREKEPALNESTALNEINCKIRQIRQIEWTILWFNGGIDKSTGTTKWENIAPETTDEALMNEVCLEQNQ